MKLTLKQENFCQFYTQGFTDVSGAFIKPGNASAAYRQAYNAENMKDETVNRKAHDLTENGKLRARIKEIQATRVQKNEISAEKIKQELAKIGFDSTGEQKTTDRVRALEILAKCEGMFIKTHLNINKDMADIPGVENLTEVQLARVSALLIDPEFMPVDEIKAGHTERKLNAAIKLVNSEVH